MSLNLLLGWLESGRSWEIVYDSTGWKWTILRESGQSDRMNVDDLKE